MNSCYFEQNTLALTSLYDPFQMLHYISLTTFYINFSSAVAESRFLQIPMHPYESCNGKHSRVKQRSVYGFRARDVQRKEAHFFQKSKLNPVRSREKANSNG